MKQKIKNRNNQPKEQSKRNNIRKNDEREKNIGKTKP